MQEKHKETIIWVGAIGGLFALATTLVTIAKSSMVTAFIAKVRGN